MKTSLFAFALAIAVSVHAQDPVGRLTNLSTRGFINYNVPVGQEQKMIVGYDAGLWRSDP
jgi:hypothetical protein